MMQVLAIYDFILQVRNTNSKPSVKKMPQKKQRLQITIHIYV